MDGSLSKYQNFALVSHSIKVQQYGFSVTCWRLRIQAAEKTSLLVGIRLYISNPDYVIARAFYAGHLLFRL